MARLLGMLVLCAGLALAQEGDDDSGISIDEKPSGPDAAPARTTPNPARAPGKKPATVTLRKKVYTLALPADWVLLEYEDEKAEIAWDVLLPGSTTRASLSLARVETGDARSWPWYQAEWFRKERPDEKVEVRVKPAPRLVAHRKRNDADWNDAYFCLSIRNNTYVLQLSCAASDFPQAETDVLAAARSFGADVEPRPPVPKGYEVSQEGGWLVARAPAVTASLALLVKTLKDQEKRFRRDHGPLPKGDPPILVLVHASQSAAGGIDKEAGEAKSAFHVDTRLRRLFAIPVGKEDRENDGQLANAAQRILFLARYGDTRPGWIWIGEGVVAQAESYCKKPLPRLDEGYANWASTLKLHRLDEMEELHRADPDAWVRECFFYVGALHAGKYKKEYDAFLDDYAETGDGPGAFERHLGTIDQEELRSSTNQFISTRIKTEKREH